MPHGHSRLKKGRAYEFGTNHFPQVMYFLPSPLRSCTRAISVYLLVAILKKKLTIDRSLGEILQIFRITLFAKVYVDQVLKSFDWQKRIILGS